MGQVPRDPNFSSVVLLTGFEIAAVQDDSSYGHTTSGSSASVALDTSIFKFGAASYSLPDAWLQWSDAAEFEFGSGDFTVEGWFRFASGLSLPSGAFDFASKYEAGGNQRSWLWQFDGTSGHMKFFVSTDGTGPTTLIDTAWAPSTATWYHLAVSRASGTLRIFVDGTQLVSAASTHNLFNSSAPFRVGGQGNNGSIANRFNGNVDEFRMTKGAGRYTSNFAPPTAAFPRS
jgi:hypothetical protein